MTLLKHSYNFVMLIEAINSNPNGDPDADNRPRMDIEERGLITDVCIKRKVRNAVEEFHGAKPGYAIYVRQGAVLNAAHDAALATAGASTEQVEAASIDEAEDDEEQEVRAKGKTKKKARVKLAEKVIADARAAMCRDYFDVRAFGSVLANKAANDAVKGPIQLGIGQSIHRIVPQQHTITRCAATNEDEGKDNKTMGRKWTVPYGLYRMHGYISAPLAAKTGFTESDLDVFWDALKSMFEVDRSAARADIHLRRLIVFRHESETGRTTAPAHKLFDTISVKQLSEDPTSYADFTISVSPIPTDVKLIELV